MILAWLLLNTAAAFPVPSTTSLHVEKGRSKSAASLSPWFPSSGQRSGRQQVHRLASAHFCSALLAATTTTTDVSAFELPEAAFQPLPLHTFAGKVEQALKDEYGKEEIQRVLNCWRLLEADHEVTLDVSSVLSSPDKSGPDASSNPVASPSMRTQHSYVPDLTVHEFWDTDKLDWADRLRQSYPAMKREFQQVTANMQALQAQGNNIWAGALTEDASAYGEGWKTLVLMNRGVWDDTNCQLFPVTARAVHDAGVPAVEVFFASMQPHSEIQPHSDFVNFVLTSHVALDIPYSGTNQCRLRIGDAVREWTNGDVLLFDTSLQHDAVNESDLTRYILMMRIWHPDLTDAERHGLQYLWDALDDATLASHDAAERKVAMQAAEARRAFPTTLGRTSTLLQDLRSGFGGMGAVSKKKKNKPRKKKR